MLLQNITLNNQYPYRMRGATATNTETGYMRSQHGTGGPRQFQRFMAFNKRSGFPTGYNPGIYMPLRMSEISSYREADYNISATAAGLRGYPIIASSTLSIVTTADILPLDDTPQAPTASSSFAISIADALGQLISSGVGDTTLSIYTNTPLMTANLSGVGSTSFSLLTNVPQLKGEASIVGGTAFAFSSTAAMLPLDDSPISNEASAYFSFSASVTPYATGALAGTAFLAGGEIDEFAVLGRMEYDNAVHIDVVNGGPGTNNPVGTLASPCNNITDALTIARGLNLNTIKLLSDYTLVPGDDVSGYTIVSDDWRVLTVESGAGTTDTVFERISLYGEMCGTWNVMIDCWVYNVTNFLGWLRGGSLERIELAPYIDPDPFSLGSSYFDHVVPMFANITSTLVMNTGVSVSFTDCTDIVTIEDAIDGTVLNISLLGGSIILSDSCIGGAAFISGTGLLTDNSTGTDVDSSGLNSTSLQFISKSIRNTKQLVKRGDTWYVDILDDDNTTPIVSKELKDYLGNEIADLQAGILAQELAQ